MNRTITKTFHQDPGHGWIEVTMNEIRVLRIEDKISAYSYRRGDTVFLEEDCDAQKFITAASEIGVSVALQEKHTNSDSVIRTYNQYTC